MEVLRYPLPENGCVDRWLVSETHCAPVAFEPVALQGEINLWLKEGFSVHENPCKTKYAAQMRGTLPLPPVQTRFAAGDTFTAGDPFAAGSTLAAGDIFTAGDPFAAGNTFAAGDPFAAGNTFTAGDTSTAGEPASAYTLRIHFPWGDDRLDLSCCHDVPTRLDAWAYTELEAPQDEDAVFEFSTCGGMHCWCNGSLAAQMQPYTRNIPQHERFCLQLRAGINTILVHLNDLAERDCVFMLRMRYCGKQPLLQRHTAANAAQIRACEESLESLCFTKNHFCTGSFLLSCENRLPGPLRLEYTCATEENEMSGVFHRGAVTFPAGHSTQELEPCERLPIGYLQFRFSARVGTAVISCVRAAENHPLSLMPPALPDVKDRKKQALSFLALYGEENTNRAVAILHTQSAPELLNCTRELPDHAPELLDCTPEPLYHEPGLPAHTPKPLTHTPELLAHAHDLLRQQIRTINARYDCSDFYLVYFPPLLRRFRGTCRLPEPLAVEMERCILGFRYWMDEPGDDVMWFFSENHALMFHTCALLAGELYPDKRFRSSGLLGRELAAKAAALLEQWFGSFFREGFTEWNSSAYLPIDMLGFASLYAFAQNGSIRSHAKQGMDFICRLLAQHSLNGILAASAGRTYPKEQFGNWSNCTGAISYLCFGEGTLSHAGKGIVSLCLSDYAPPEEYRAWLSAPKGKFFEIFSTHGYQKHAALYTYKAAGLLLTAAYDFCPGKPGYQENPFQLAFSPTAQIFISHPGEKAVWGCGRPSYWAGNGILPQVHACRGAAVLMYEIPASHPVAFTHLYFPIAEFEHWEQHGNLLLCASGNAYAAVFCSLPPERCRRGSNTDREWIARGRRAVWLVRTGVREQYQSFARFCAVMRGARFAPHTENRLAVSYQDAAGVRIEDQYGGVLTHNGKCVTVPLCDQYGSMREGVFKECAPEAPD